MNGFTVVLLILVFIFLCMSIFFALPISEKKRKMDERGRQIDECGHHTFWKYCPGCAIKWVSDSEQESGCWKCGFVRRDKKQ